MLNLFYFIKANKTLIYLFIYFLLIYYVNSLTVQNVNICISLKNFFVCFFSIVFIHAIVILFALLVVAVSMQISTMWD